MTVAVMVVLGHLAVVLEHLLIQMGSHLHAQLGGLVARLDKADALEHLLVAVASGRRFLLFGVATVEVVEFVVCRGTLFENFSSKDHELEYLLDHVEQVDAAHHDQAFPDVVVVLGVFEILGDTERLASEKRAWKMSSLAGEHKAKLGLLVE